MSYHAKKKKGKKGKGRKTPNKPPTPKIEKKEEWPINSLDLTGSEADFLDIIENEAANGLAKLIHNELEVRPFAIEWLTSIIRRIYHADADIAGGICADLLWEGEVDLVRTYLEMLQDDEEYGSDSDFYFTMFNFGLSINYDNQNAMVAYFNLAPEDYDWHNIISCIEQRCTEHKDVPKFLTSLLKPAIETNTIEVIFYIIEFVETKSLCPCCQSSLSDYDEIIKLTEEYKKASVNQMKEMIKYSKEKLAIAESNLIKILLNDHKIKSALLDYLTVKNEESEKIDDYYQVRKYSGMKELLKSYGKNNLDKELITFSLQISLLQNNLTPKPNTPLKLPNIPLRTPNINNKK